MRKKTISMIMVLTLCFGLVLGTIGSAGLVVAQENQTDTTVNQTDGSNTSSSSSSSNASTTAGNVTTAEQFENITHGGGPGAGATNQSER
jgi:capsular polysaccharide biosynthesis protein